MSTLATILILAVSVGLLAYILARQYRAHRERQWLHEETMTALKQGIAVDLPGKDSMTAKEISRPNTIELRLGSNLPFELFWMRVLSLFFGILGLFIGAGILVAFIISEDQHTREVWPMGLIPISGGMGMLVLYFLITHLFESPQRPAMDESE